MLVVLAENLPNAVRGKMKLWFIEPRPNVFVSNVSDQLAEMVATKLLELCDESSGLLIIESMRKMPGYKISSIQLKDKLKEICGIQLIRQNANETDKEKVQKILDRAKRKA